LAQPIKVNLGLPRLSSPGLSDWVKFISRWRHMLHGERINYGMLAFESAKR
jgi:hypothetical protein